MVKQIKIEWKKIDLNNIRSNKDTFYYAFSRGKTLLYIGISYRQNISDEVIQTLRRLKIGVKGLSVWLGYVNILQTSFGRLSERIVLDAECLMIYTNHPAYNTLCDTHYTGRCDFRVKTSGCPLIRKCVVCEKQKIYLTCKHPKKR